MTDEMRKAAREWCMDPERGGQEPTDAEYTHICAYEAGWQACASRPLTDRQVDDLADALFLELCPGIRMTSGDRQPYRSAVLVVHAALSRLRGASDD